MTTTKEKINREDLQSRLTPEQYRITQEKGTEPAFSGEYVDSKDDGMYSCVVCSNPLFRSDAKYDSGSGWPSFWIPLAGDRVRTHLDESHGMRREEVLCANCDAHLGHVFPDGPQPSGNRYCINSASLDFAMAEECDSFDAASTAGES
jgi:peptide-methionine (R)-S-oxide reductase